MIEIVVVMAIIAVLAVLVVGAINIARHTATETTHRENAKTLRICLEGYKARYGAYCGGGGFISCSNQGFSTVASAMTVNGFNCDLANTSDSVYGGGNIQGSGSPSSFEQGGTLRVYNWDGSDADMENIPFP